MLVFDLRTVVLLLAAISVVVAVLLALVSRLVDRRYPGLPILAWSAGLNAAGFVLLMLRGAIPDLWSVVVGNVALVGALALSLYGANRFLGRPRPGQEGVAVAVVLATAALLFPLTFVFPSVGLRTAVVNGAIGTLDLLYAWSLLAAPVRHLAASRRFTAAVFLASGPWHLLSAALAAVGRPAGGVFSPTLAQALAFLIPLAVLLLFAAGVVAMVVQRLLHDVQAAQWAERDALAASARDAERRADEARELLEALTEASRIVREREQLFRLTFDRSPLGAALIAPDGAFLRVNDALVQIVGHDEAALLRRDVLSIVVPEDRAVAEERAAALVAGAERVTLEVRALRAETDLVWLQITAGLVRDEAGEPLHIVALAEDITGRKRTEQRLREIERQQQLVLRTIPEQFWLKDTAGRYILASRSLAGFHGRQPHELIGHTAEELFAPAHSELIRVGDDVVRSEREYDAEVELVDHAGAARWLTTSRAPVYDDDGSLVGIVGVARDITAYKRAEAALVRSNRRLELALWGAELGLWDWHIPSGTIETNPQLARLLGLEPHELFPVVEVWNRHTHPDDLEANTAAFVAAIEGQADGVDVEFRVLHRDGGWRWNAARGRVVERDASGRAIRLIGITRDITPRRSAQEELQAREALLRSVSDNLPDGLIYQLERAPDGARRYRYLSAGVEPLWGLTAEEAYADAEALWSRIHPDDRPGYEAVARQARIDMTVFEYEMRVCMPDGRVRWAFCRSTPQLLADGRLLHSGVEIDVTARKQAEASLQRRVHELTVLYQITHALTSWTSLAEGLVPVTALLREVFVAAAVTVWEHDAGGRCLRPLAGLAGAPREPLRAAELGEAHEALERTAASLRVLAPEHPLLAGEPGPARHTLLVPLRARQALLGLLCVSPQAAGRLYTPEDVALAQTVAGVLASAVDNARLFAAARSAAAEQERRRLARELHDSVSQALFAASRIAETLPLLWELDPDEGREALGNLHRFTTGALAEMRALLVELRPPALVEAPLHETLAVLAPAARARGGAEVQVLLAPAPLLPPEVQVALYRVAQEALNNVVKHARASRAAVTLSVEPPALPGEPWEGTAALSVVDNGRGFVPGPFDGARFGLETMRERAAEIGAALDVESSPGGGTRISVSWRGAARQPGEPEPVTL